MKKHENIDEQTRSVKDSKFRLPHRVFMKNHMNFEMKKKWIRNEMKRIRMENSKRKKLTVRRNFILYDAFRRISGWGVRHLKSRNLKIVFHGETVNGREKKDFFRSLSKDFVDPDYGLFIHVDKTNCENKYSPNPMSILVYPDDFEKYFRFVGRVVGMSIYHQCLLGCYFSVPFLKQVLGIPLNFEDLREHDLSLHRNLKWMKENDVDTLDLTFAIEEDFLGAIRPTELKPGGLGMKVTNENKEEYIDLVVHYKLEKKIKKQVDSFRKGFHEVISPEQICMFSAKELHLFLTLSPPEFSNLAESLNSIVVYENGYSESSETIGWFWKWVGDLSLDERVLFLDFVSGLSKLSDEGHQNRFIIHKEMSGELYPTSIPYDFQLNLPCYECEEDLRGNLDDVLRRKYGRKFEDDEIMDLDLKERIKFVLFGDDESIVFVEDGEEREKMVTKVVYSLGKCITYVQRVVGTILLFSLN